MSRRLADQIAAGRGRFRASDDDREQAIEDLKVAFVQGRLTRDELAERAGRALTSRTFADLAAVAADVPATRPRPKRGGAQAQAPARAPARAPVPAAAPARKATRRRANPRVLTWGLAVATIALPALIAAALVTKSQNLFTASVLMIMAFVMAARVAAANVVADRLESYSADESREQVMPRLASLLPGHVAHHGAASRTTVRRRGPRCGVAHHVRRGYAPPVGRHSPLVAPPVSRVPSVSRVLPPPARSARIHPDATPDATPTPPGNNIDGALLLLGQHRCSIHVVSRRYPGPPARGWRWPTGLEGKAGRQRMGA